MLKNLSKSSPLVKTRWAEFKKELTALRLIDGFKGWVRELVVMTQWPGLLFKSISKSKMCKLKKPHNQTWPLNHAVKCRNIRIPIVISRTLLISTGELNLAAAFRCFCSTQMQIQSLVYLCFPSCLEKNTMMMMKKCSDTEHDAVCQWWITAKAKEKKAVFFH